MTEKRYDVIDKLEPRGQSVTYDGIPCTAKTCVTRLNRLTEENEQLKKKILEEIDLEVAYVNETYSDGRMSKEQHNGAIISLRQLREKFE